MRKKKGKVNLKVGNGNEIDIYHGSNDCGIESYESVTQMAMKLKDMKDKMDLVQKFFKEVMIEGQDYGTFIGTSKPTLLKAGAEKLNEFYGYAPQIKEIEEDADEINGYYRARVTVALVHRRTGTVIAEGVGEANTMESKFRYRWIPEYKMPKNSLTEGLVYETRKDKEGNYYKCFRIENDDPWSLWNTILKMAKKRALIDATLSATRSSGIFTQDLEDLKEWINVDVVNSEYVDENGEVHTHNSYDSSFDDIMQTVITFGKHKGKTMQYLLENNRDYLEWLAESDNKKYSVIAQKVLELGKTKTEEKQVKPAEVTNQEPKDIFAASTDESEIDIPPAIIKMASRVGMTIDDLNGYIKEHYNKKYSELDMAQKRDLSMYLSSLASAKTDS